MTIHPMNEFLWAMWSYPVPLPVSGAILLAVLGYVLGLHQGAKLGSSRIIYPVTTRRTYDE